MGDRISGGSPLEKVVTTWPLPIVLPHVSTRITASAVGHEAGAEKLLTSPVCVGTSLPPAQDESACGRGTALLTVLPAGVVVFSTTRVIFTELTTLPKAML